MSTKQAPHLDPTQPPGARAPAGPNIALRLVLVAVIALTLLALVLKQAF